MNYGLSEENINLLVSIFEKYIFIEKVVLYGSRAKGNYTKRSDIDFVVFGKPKDRFEISKVINEIEESSIPYNIDLQLFDDLKNFELINHINRVGKLFYQRK
jgi:predicted nucleotidyltransferase